MASGPKLPKFTAPRTPSGPASSGGAKGPGAAGGGPSGATPEKKEPEKKAEVAPAATQPAPAQPEAGKPAGPDAKKSAPQPTPEDTKTEEPEPKKKVAKKVAPAQRAEAEKKDDFLSILLGLANTQDPESIKKAYKAFKEAYIQYRDNQNDPAKKDNFQNKSKDMKALVSEEQLSKGLEKFAEKHPIMANFIARAAGIKMAPKPPGPAPDLGTGQTFKVAAPKGEKVSELAGKLSAPNPPPEGPKLPAPGQAIKVAAPTGKNIAEKVALLDSKLGSKNQGVAPSTATTADATATKDVMQAQNLGASKSTSGSPINAAKDLANKVAPKAKEALEKGLEEVTSLGKKIKDSMKPKQG